MNREARISYLLTIAQFTVGSCIIISSVEIIQYMVTKTSWTDFITKTSMEEDPAVKTEESIGKLLSFVLFI